MNKYIFFRTDRIGDFLLSAVLIKAIKRNDQSSHITVVCSNKNYNFVKEINYVDSAILYPNNILDKIKFFFNLLNKKYFFSCILDGKKRSIYLSLIIKAKIKIFCTYKIFYRFIFNFFFTKILVDNKYLTKKDEMNDILKLLNLELIEEDLNILTNRNYNHDHIYNFINNKKNFILFHLDEKWIYDQYLKSYTTIQPNSYLDLIEFLKKITNLTNKDLFISTGYFNNKFTENFVDDFNKYDKDIFKLEDSNIYFLNNLNLNQLEFAIANCSTFISCHGAPTHLASSFNKKIIDIIDSSEKIFFDKWSSHFRNHNQLIRDKFTILSNLILKKLIKD